MCFNMCTEFTFNLDVCMCVCACVCITKAEMGFRGRRKKSVKDITSCIFKLLETQTIFWFQFSILQIREMRTKKVK